MKLSPEKLKDLLVPPGHVSEEDFLRAAEEAKRLKRSLEETILERGLLRDDELGKLLAEAEGAQFINLRKEKIDEDVLGLIPEPVARKRRVIAFARTSEGVKVAMEDPHDLRTVHLVEKRVGTKVIPYFATKLDISEALSHYKASLREEFARLIFKWESPSASRDDKEQMAVRMVDTLLEYGYYNRASDIHIEPHTENILIRFRIDGVMHDMVETKKDLIDPIVTRIKILAKMRTDEHRANLEGRLTFEAEEEDVDVRISIVPVPEGENTVLRLLSEKNRELSVGTLGFAPRDEEKIMEVLKRPHGMVLATGPTGCGKTTTVYAVLKVLNAREVNIATIEDPIEYHIEGVTQIQVNSAKDITFAHGLRAIIRQDPDIIMVGEIRDEETANIAINAAMTGHVLLSTLHANDAGTTLTRLIDMGIEPFLVSSTANLIIAQRLVRKICERCRISYEMTKDEKKTVEDAPQFQSALKKFKGEEEVIRLYKGKGCDACGGTGYAGRTGIFEVLTVTDAIKDLVMKRAPSGEVMKEGVREGMTTMLEDGIEKVLNGITTLEEIFRATQE